MSKEKPNFYAVIPATVRYDKALSSSEKLFYAEITAMSQKEGYCWASNSYFSELFGVSRSTISSWVSGLEEKEHIKVQQIRKGKQIKQRNIYPLEKDDQISDQGWSDNQKRVVRKQDKGWSENPKENNTRVNTTSNNNTSSVYDFDDFWNDYDKKKDKRKCEKKWEKVGEEDRNLIKEFIPIYRTHQPNQKYRKNPLTFLNAKIWEDDWDAYPPVNINSNQSTNGTNRKKKGRGNDASGFLHYLAGKGSA